MTHVMESGTDLDDLLGGLADDLAAYEVAGDPDRGTDEQSTEERPPLVRPMAGLTSPAWYA